MDTSTMAIDAEQRRKNLRLAVILASIAAAFFIGFVAKIALFSH